MSTNQNTNEEVDLGSLFLIIGKGFKNFFNFIGSLLKGIFHFFILIALFFKKNFKKLAITAIIGGILGGVLEMKKEKRFASSLILQPNFKSSQQLYTNINYYNDLIKQKDTLVLQKIFKLSGPEAASLKKFEVNPIETENNILSSYNQLIKTTDTAFVKNYDYETFKENFKDYDYEMHEIYVEATRNNVFSKLDDIIISSIIRNAYFSKIQKFTNIDLNRRDSILNQNLVQVDSLRKVYVEVMISEAKKTSTGTTIDFGKGGTGTKEIELFESNRQINKDLAEVMKEKSRNSEMINVISEFQPIGYELNKINRNYIFVIPIALIILIIAFQLFKEINLFLENYKK